MGARASVAAARAAYKPPYRGNPHLADIGRKYHAEKRERDQQVVNHVMAENQGLMSNRQVVGLARSLKRSKEAIAEMVQNARQKFVESAETYVDAHRQAVQQALDNGDPISLGVAAKASQWAMENLGSEGNRIIDRVKIGAVGDGSRIQIGINLGHSRSETNGVVIAKVDPPVLEGESA